VRRASSAVVVAVLASSAAVLLSSAGLLRADDDVLHEFVPDLDPDEPLRALSREGPAPEAIEYEGELLPAPTAPAADAPLMVAEPGDGAGAEQPGQRSPTFRPDRITDLEGELDYHAAFTPSIAPFKRVTALDAVVLADDGRTPLLVLSRAERERVAIEGADAAPPDLRPRDRFWGEATLDFGSGSVLPLPSVSPESRILSLRSEPAVQMTVERDRADNYHAVLLGGAPAAPVFVSFLTDAPRSYFGASLPDAPVTALAAHVAAMPEDVARRALGFASELGLSHESRLPAALAKLTEHFRAFEESSEPPPDTGDVYLDLARGMKGICRHRSYAFMITAQALGIPTRFVQNEAHSWVEVELPELGFMRIDLGGAAHGLTAHGASERPPYQPAQSDPLPRPPAYEQSYSQAAAAAQGARKPGIEELRGRWVSPQEDVASAQAEGRASFMGGPSGAATSEPAPRQPLQLVLSERRLSALRGRTLLVAGEARALGGQGVAGLRVEISLAAEGRRDRLLLGVGVTGVDGAFAAQLGVPPDLEPGDYRLVVVTPGDATHAPAIAE
jgi:hypothetical protein